MAFEKGKALVRKALGLSESKKGYSLTDPAIFDVFGLAPTSSRIAVSIESALRVPAVFCAVSKIADTIGDLPPKLYRRATKVVAKDHPAYKLIHDEANEWTSAAQLRMAVQRDALLHGNGYAIVTRSFNGRPLALDRVGPSLVRNEFELDGTPYYVIQIDQRPVRFEFVDVLHVQAPGGMSPIYAGREAIGLALAFERYIASLFANGGRPSGILTTKKTLDAEAKKKLVASWFGSHAGSNSGSTAILDEDMTYQQLSMTLTDAQFVENRLEQIREIARVFNVPPTMLFELTRGTWSNTEEMARQFYQITLKPWLTAWQWAYARVLLTPVEREQLYVEFVTDDLLTTDFVSKATALSQYRAMGAMTGNEVRAMLNLPAHPEGETLSNPHITTSTPAEPAPGAGE